MPAQLPPTTVAHKAGQKRGLCSAAHGSIPAGAWAIYDGPSLQDGAVLQSVVASQPRRQHDGAMQTMFRCRHTALGPAADVWCSRSDVVRIWPDNGETAIADFSSTCVAAPQ